MMVDSQEEAKAAALRQLGYDVPQALKVVTVADGSPAAGVLQPGDEVVAAAGAPVTTVDQLRAAIAAAGGSPLTLTIVRGGQRQDVTVTPTRGSSAGAPWVVGITLGVAYTYPIDVTIQLDNVGGPSAGICSRSASSTTLTPDDLTGGHRVAGTGTITADGTVGPIGGIRQKMWEPRGPGPSTSSRPRRIATRWSATCRTACGVLGVDAERLPHGARRDPHGGNLDALPTCS